MLLKFFENNHRCVPFRLFITNINLLLLLFFLSIASFDLFWISSPLNDIKYQLYYLKSCLYTQKLYLFIVTRFLYLFIIISCSFSVFVENCIFLPKGINELVVFLSIVHLWFRLFTLLPRFFLLVIKGTNFHRTQILFQNAFFSVTKM